MANPKIRVIRVTGAPVNSIKPIDLGVIDIAAIENVGYIELIPYASGSLIEEVFFATDQYETMTSTVQCHFGTPNTILLAPDLGMAKFDPAQSGIIDTEGLFIGSNAPMLPPNDGIPGSNNRIRDTGPLFAFSHQTPSWYGAWMQWTANTRYAINENIIKNGFIQAVTSNGNGISGSTEPTWNNTINGNTTDGTVTWTNLGAIATQGKIHVIATVTQGVNTDNIQRIGGVVFVQQPTNVVHGATMSPSVTVKVLDQSGNPYTMLPVGVSLFIIGSGTLTGGGSGLGGDNPKYTDQTTGIATFDSLSIAETANGYILRARAHYTINITPTDSSPFNVT